MQKTENEYIIERVEGGAVMTIHHDKMAYGKLAASAESMSEETILKMLAELNDEGVAEADPSSEKSPTCTEGISLSEKKKE